jgi:hypothetical protein
MDIMGFFVFSASLEANGRPKSRRYLEWLASQARSMAQQAGEGTLDDAGVGRIVIP